MLTSQIIKNCLEEMSAITRTQFSVQDLNGNVIAATAQMAAPEAAMVSGFAHSAVDSQIIGTSYLLKVLDEGEPFYILTATGSSDYTFMVAKMVAGQLQSLITAYKERLDRGNFFQNLLLDNLLAVDIHNRARKLHIAASGPRAVVVFDIAPWKGERAGTWEGGSPAPVDARENGSGPLFRGTGSAGQADQRAGLSAKRAGKGGTRQRTVPEARDDLPRSPSASAGAAGRGTSGRGTSDWSASGRDSSGRDSSGRGMSGWSAGGSGVPEAEAAAAQMLAGLFSPQSGDYLTEVEENSVILIKSLASVDAYDELERCARTAVDMLGAEAMVDARAAFGTIVTELRDLSKSYKEARMAMDVGQIFYAGRKILSYNELGIGRLIYQLPVTLCRMFLQEIFGDYDPSAIDQESLATIQTFFDNNLNVSETSRQLFIHRNTLVYRMEKLQKATGLDIRAFEDAMTFRIALMVSDYMKFLERKG